MIYLMRTAALFIALFLGSLTVMAAEKLVIYTVNYPLQYFAQRIGGTHVDVHFPAPADVDPVFWKPDIKTVGEYQRADLILLNGANYAKWVNKISLPRLRTIDTSRSFRDQYIKVSATTTHSHGPSGDHSHSGTAFTTWLDPMLASQQAKAIHDALVKKRPDLIHEFSEKYAMLNNELLKMDDTIKQIVSKQPRQPLLASHPVYQYFARRYNLNLVSVLWEPDVEPSEADWVAMRNLTSQHPARWIIWEEQPIHETMQRLRGLAVNSVVYKPCANRPEQGDYLSVMTENIEHLKTAFPEMQINLSPGNF